MFGTLRLPDSIVFGRGQRRAIGAAAARLGSRALVCTDARLAETAEFAEMIADLEANGVDPFVFSEAIADLPAGSILECAQRASDFSPELVIGIGGGSCLDLAKAVAVILSHGGQVSDYYGEFAVPGPVLPLIAVPTTSGTGSEATPVAVVLDEERGSKIGIASPYIVPRIAICDSELTRTCPRGLTACSGADALAHAVEAYTAKAQPVDALLTETKVFVGKNVLSDHFAKLAVENVFRYLVRACEDGDDMEARDGLMLAALAAGCAFGTGGTSAAHALQYPVGNLTHTAHGDGIGALLPYTLQFSRVASVDTLAELAVTAGLGAGEDDAEALSQRFIDEVAQLLALVGVPTSLAALGVSETQVEEIASGALKAERIIRNNPRELDLPGALAITRAALAGDRRVLADA